MTPQERAEKSAAAMWQEDRAAHALLEGGPEGEMAERAGTVDHFRDGRAAFAFEQAQKARPVLGIDVLFETLGLF